MLYRITGDQHYRDIASQVGDMIAGWQNPNGSYSYPGLGHTPGEEPELTNTNYDLTAEFTLWLALISSNILARDAA